MNHKSWTEERQIIQWTDALYYLSFFYSWLMVHLLIVLSVFLLFMTCGSFGHCINCLSSIRGLWFICPLYYLSFFCSWLVVHLPIVLSVFLLFLTCGSFGHCIFCLSSTCRIQWTNEPQVMNRRKTNNTMAKWPQATNRRKTDNTMAKWTTSHEQKKDR
jgi:hypothetical protein